MTESSSSKIPPAPSPRRHRAFWHGLLFLLPVVLLAGIGLRGLRSERLAVLEAARLRAKELCERIAQDFDAAYKKILEQPHTEVTKDHLDAFLYPLAPEPPEDLTPSIAYEAAGNDEEKLRALLVDHPDGHLASGLPLAPFVHYQLALRQPTDPQRVKAFIQSAIQDAPSVITPRLLDELEAEGAVLSEARAAWQRDERARSVFRRHRDEIRDGPDHSRWQFDRDAYWMEVLDGSRLALIPQTELAAAAKAILAGAEIPEFLALDLRFSVLPLAVSKLVWRSLPIVREKPPFADAYLGSVNVRASLIKEAALFRAYHRQRAWFIGIIAAASLAALAGYLATRRALREQERLNARMSNFVSSVSHELRAPVAAIRLLAERLREGRVEEAEKQREYFGFIDQESRRLTALIGNVLDFSRIEQGRKSYEFIETDLVELVRNTVALMQPLAEEKSIRLLVETTPLASDPVLDGGAVQQALVNLLDNAVKFSPEGSAVTVTLAPSPENATFLDLAVADEGIGIPAAEQARVFERFYRVGSELRRESKGVGIGLSIVRHLAEAHGGKVTVASDGTRGSTFTLHLPLAHG